MKLECTGQSFLILIKFFSDLKTGNPFSKYELVNFFLFLRRRYMEDSVQRLKSFYYCL